MQNSNDLPSENKGPRDNRSTPVSAATSAPSKGSDDAESRNVASKESIREQIKDDVEQFLAEGGSIDKIDPHITSDPPKKPESNYGRRPI